MATTTLTAGAGATTLAAAGAATLVQVTNTGTGNAVVSPGGIRLRPGRSRDFETEGRAVTAYSTDGTTLNYTSNTAVVGLDRVIDGGTP